VDAEQRAHSFLENTKRFPQLPQAVSLALDNGHSISGMVSVAKKDTTRCARGHRVRTQTPVLERYPKSLNSCSIRARRSSGFLPFERLMTELTNHPVPMPAHRSQPAISLRYWYTHPPISAAPTKIGADHRAAVLK
jgi:hypothetical protein